MNANKIVNKILSTIVIIKKLRQFSKISVSTVKLAINLEEYLFIVNQAVGPKFNSFFKDLEKVDGADEMVDYHENFISDFTKKLLDDAIQEKEIQNIDTKAFSILLGGIGREFLKEKNRDSINSSPEDSANSITSIILNGIKLKN